MRENESTVSVGEGHVTAAGFEHDAHAAAASAQAEGLFTRDEIEQFDADDENAGGTIGKMLALFFLYTVIVMSVVAWWTYDSVKGP
jgi:hypothetical protein